jgi:hypothetical protein
MRVCPGPPKAKAVKMDLGAFLQDSCTCSIGDAAQAEIICKLIWHVALGSWADEMEDMPMPSAPSGRGGYGGDRSYGSGGGFGSSGFKGMLYAGKFGQLS